MILVEGHFPGKLNGTCFTYWISMTKHSPYMTSSHGMYHYSNINHVQNKITTKYVTKIPNPLEATFKLSLLCRISLKECLKRKYLEKTSIVFHTSSKPVKPSYLFVRTAICKKNYNKQKIIIITMRFDKND